MPIYAYKCRNCGEKFEAVRRMSDRDEELTCPECNTANPMRVLSNICARNSTISSSGGGYRVPT